MDWREEGILLTVRRHGETSAIIEVFTKTQGRYAGVVRGGVGRKMAPVLQPAAQLDLTWRARLEEHIGSFTVEPIKSRAVQIMGDRLALEAVNSLTALLSFALPERAAYPKLYERTIALVDMIGVSPAWPVAYLRWELALLSEMGFGLDLDRCAVTGATEDLRYVSPNSGRAVTEAGAGEYRDRLLPLSPAMTEAASGDMTEVAQGLVTTGFFLANKLAPELAHRPLPEARARFVAALERAAEKPE